MDSTVNSTVRERLLVAVRRASLDNDDVLFDLWNDICSIADHQFEFEGSTSSVGANLVQASIVHSMMFRSERFALWCDLLVTFDLQESLAGLLLLLPLPDGTTDALFAAAKLAGSPAVDEALREEVERLASTVELTDYESALVLAVLRPGRAVGETVANREDLNLLIRHRWPGLWSTAEGLALPVVVLMTNGFPTPSELTIMGDIAASGALLRRAAPMDVNAPLSEAIQGPGVITAGRPASGAQAIIPDSTGLTWIERLSFISHLKDEAERNGLSLDIDSFVRLRATTEDQVRAASAFLTAAETRPVFAVSEAQQYWAGGVERLLRQRRTEATVSAALRDRISLSIAEKIRDSYMNSTPLSVDAAIQSALDELGEEGNAALRETVESVASEVIGTVPPHRLHYLDSGDLLVSRD